MPASTSPLLRSGAFLLTALVIGPCRGADGAVIFENNCASCHGLDGKARTPAGRKIGAKDLAAITLDDKAIAAQIRNGVKTPQGGDRMPAFKERLKPEEISAVVAHVRTFRKK